MTLRFVATRASAIIPIAMSFAALGVLAAALLFGWGKSPDTDEGAAAHLWQLLMLGQVPVMAYFWLRWLTAAPKEGLTVVVVQIGAALAAATPVFLLHL